MIIRRKDSMPGLVDREKIMSLTNKRNLSAISGFIGLIAIFIALSIHAQESKDSLRSFIEELKTIDRIIRHLELIFESERPPPNVLSELLTAAEKLEESWALCLWM
jgi:hypothetical protein